MASLEMFLDTNGDKTLDWDLHAYIESVTIRSLAVGGAATVTLEETRGSQEKLLNAVACTASGDKIVPPRKKAYLNDGVTERGDAWYLVNGPLKMTLAGAVANQRVTLFIQYTPIEG